MQINRLTRDVLIYAVTDGLAKFAVFVSSLLYTQYMQPSEIGLLNTATVSVSLLFVIISVGGESTYLRFFSDAVNLTQQRAVTATWLIFLALWSGLVAALLVPNAAAVSNALFQTPGHDTLILLVVATTPLWLLNRIAAQVLRNQFRAGTFATLNVLNTILSIGLSLYLAVGLSLGVAGVLLGNLISLVLMLPVRLLTVHPFLRWQFSPSLLIHMLQFGAPLILMEFAYWIFVSSDRFLLTHLSTLDQVGYYALANTIVSVILSLNTSVGQAWPVYALRTYQSQTPEAPWQFGRVAAYILIGFGIICFSVTLFTPELLVIMSRPAFYPAAEAVGPLSLAALAYVSTQFTSLSISLKKLTIFYVVFSWITALLNIGLNLVWIPVWGMMAAAWSSVICYSLLSLAYLGVSQRLWPIKYQQRRMLILLAVTIAAILMIPLLRPLEQTDLLIRLLGKGLFLLTFVGALRMLGVITRQEVDLAAGVFRSFRSRLSASHSSGL